ncbi:MAG: preprotein translocase subunit SecG [Chloroflexota bacterium]|jgi:preprotein translocase subunit SecG|nr:preprotein translocase subunit SecG [Chloroflexota bacterium]
MDVLLPYLNAAQILVSLLLIVLVLMQLRGSGFSTGYSSDSSIYRTRRGMERTLFQMTIGVGVAFVVLSVLSVLVPKFAG